MERGGARFQTRVTTLFISDLHLHPSRPDVISCFVNLLKQQPGNAGALYILGDLFETWVGDDHPEPAYQPVKTALKNASRAGTSIYLLHGNRDFLLGNQFCRETGCTLLQDPARIELHGIATLLMHGDSLCIDDKEYQVFRKMVRDPDWQARALDLPLEQRLETASEARLQSKQATLNKTECIMDVNQGEVRKIMQQHSVRCLIHGHTHRPGMHSIKLDTGEATRIVLGDWHCCGSVLRVDRQGNKTLEKIPL